jgi:hypothetical protein
MNRIIRTVLASVGAVAVVSGGALGVAYATTSAPAQSAGKGASSAELTKTADDLVSQINKLEKDLSEPMPTPTSTATSEAERPSVEASQAATRAATKATAATKTTEHRESDEKSGDSKDSDD